VLLRDVLGVRSVDPVAREIVLGVSPGLPLTECRGDVPLSEDAVLHVAWRKATDGPDVTWKLPEGWKLRRQE